MKAIYFVKSDIFVVATADNRIVYKVHNPTHSEIAANLPAGVMLTYDETGDGEAAPAGADKVSTAKN